MSSMCYCYNRCFIDLKRKISDLMEINYKISIKNVKHPWPNRCAQGNGLKICRLDENKLISSPEQIHEWHSKKA